MKFINTSDWKFIPFRTKLILLAASFIIGAGVENAAASDVFPLQINIPATREFRSGERHRFSVEANIGEALEIIADKKGIDIGLTVFAPDNNKISVSNAPNGFIGREILFFIAEKSGKYQIEVISKRPGNVTGAYTITLINRRPAKENDSERAAAMKLSGEAREVLHGSENRVEKAAAAIAKLQKALVSFEKLNDLQNQANTLFHIAYITANEYGEDRDAILVYEKALEIWHIIDDEAGKAVGLTFAAVELRESRNAEKSLKYFNQALLIDKKLGDKPGEAVTLTYLCRLYNDTGDFQKGFETCREALRLGQNSDPLTDNATYLNLAALYENTGDFENALVNYQKSAQRLLPIGDFVNPIRAANAKGNIGVVLSLQKKYAEAVPFFLEAVAVSEAVSRPLYAVYYLAQLSENFLIIGQPSKALEYAERSLALERQSSSRKRPVSLSVIGKSYAALGRTDKARESFSEVLEITRQNKDHHAEADTLYNLAELEKNAGNLEKARQYIQMAISISEIIRADLLGNNSRSSYLAILKSYYELEIELLIKSDDKNPSAGFSEQAWQKHEKIRARSLLENFLENGLSLNSFAPPDFYTKERELLEAIAAAELKRGESEKTKNIALQNEAERNLQKSLENYQVMQEDVRRKNPQFSAVNQLKDFSFADVQNSLDDDTALVEFALGKSQSYIWLFRKNSVKLYKLPARDDINQTAREFYTVLTTLDSKNDELTIEKSKRLSQRILQPLTADLAKVKRLIVIADGSLQLVPFSALTLAPDADFQPLTATLEIVNAPSFSTLVYLRENKNRRQSAPDKLLTIFADPIFQPDDERLAKVKTTKILPNSGEETAKLSQTLRDFGIERLARLPFTGIEAREIARYVPQQTFLALGADASRRRFLDGDFNSYKIMHFATHGFLNQRNPDLSGLVLSLYDEKRRSQNGFLRVIDLYSLHLNSDLVVLSACQTGLGKEVDGEGIVGLTRGFMFAGASSVVSSLWKVEDAATAELMKRFYRAMLVENQTPSTALHTAQNELRRIPRFSHPRYWAGFVLTGEWR